MMKKYYMACQRRMRMLFSLPSYGFSYSLAWLLKVALRFLYLMNCQAILIMKKTTTTKIIRLFLLKRPIKNKIEVIRKVNLSGLVRKVKQYLEKNIWADEIANSIVTICTMEVKRSPSGRRITTGTYTIKNGNIKAVAAAFIDSHPVDQYLAPAIWDATRAPMATGGVKWE